MSTTHVYSRIRWACRRGMLELDLMLIPFWDTHSQKLSASDQAIFETLLTHSDPEIFSWLMGHATPQDENLIPMVNNIRHYAQTLL